jgi:uncharacterized membrane protein
VPGNAALAGSRRYQLSPAETLARSLPERFGGKKLFFFPGQEISVCERILVPLAGILLFAAILYIVIPASAVQSGGNATLAAVIGSDIKGTANLAPFQGGQYTVVDVHLQHLTPGAIYALSLRSGSCSGTLVAALQPATIVQDGQGTSSTTISGAISASWFIVLHTGPSINNAVLACGQVVLSTTIGGGTPIPGTPNVYLTPSLTPGSQTPGVPGQFPNTGGGQPDFPIP